LTGVVAPTVQDLAGPGKDDFEAQLLATESIANSGELSARGVFGALGPHASDTVSPGLLERVARMARDLSLPVHWHLAQSYEEHRAIEERGREFSTAALEALGEATVLMAHGLYLTDKDCARLASAGWVLAYCPLSQLQFGFLSPLSPWLEAGGRWAIGTDCVASNDALDLQRELPLVGGNAALRASVSNERRQYAASGGGQAALDLEERRRQLLAESSIAKPEILLRAAWGADLCSLRAVPFGLAKGALANFLVLDPDHPSLFPGDDLARVLAYGATSSAIDWMVVGGQRMGHEGQGLKHAILDSDAFRQTITEARRRREELFERAKIGQAR
jgi:cytosine/adenosine deaminase-related metal-dependent hydrolase